MGFLPPCLICSQVVGVKTEISDEVQVDADANLEDGLHNNHSEQLLSLETNVENVFEVENGSTFLLVHYFYQLFQIEPETSWNFDGGSEQFCPLCKQRLQLLMELQRKLEELNGKLETGKGELKKVIETSEESWQNEGFYEKDKRYWRIRRQILGQNKINQNLPVPTTSHQHQPAAEINRKDTCSSSRRSSRSRNSPKTQVGSEVKSNPFVLLSATDRIYAEIRKEKKEPFEEYHLSERDTQPEVDNFPPSAWTSSDSDFENVGVADEMDKNFDVSRSESDPDYEVKPKTKSKLKVVKKNRISKPKSSRKPTESKETKTPAPVKRSRDRCRQKKNSSIPASLRDHISKSNQLQDEETDNLGLESEDNHPEPKRKRRMTPLGNKGHEEDPDFIPAEGQDEDILSSSEEEEDDDEEFDLRSYKYRTKSCIDPSTGNYTFLNITLEKLVDDDNGRKRFQCTKCLQTITIIGSASKHQLDQRVKSHVYEKHTNRYKCEQCDKRFISHSGRLRHVYRMHEKRLVLCTICEKPFSQMSAMKRHRRSHLNEEEKQILNQRKQIRITTEPKIQCEDCGQIFREAHKLQKHRQAKHGTEEDRAKHLELCPECGKYVLHLKSHTKKMHNKNTFRSYPCLKCNKRFKDAPSLRRHKNVVHENIRKFKCDFCPKTFFERKMLEIHKNVHLNIRQFQCEHCPSAFTRLYHLQRHVGVYHEGVPKRPIFVRGPKKRGFEGGAQPEPPQGLVE